MSAQQSSTKTSEGSRASGTRLYRRWFLLARGVWITQVVLTLAIFFASLPVYVVLLRTPCSGSACSYLQLTPEQAEALKGTGLFPGVYTAYTVVLTLVTMAVCLLVSIVIVLRRADDRMALLVALLLLSLGPSTLAFNVSAIRSPWQVPNECLSFLFVTLLPLVFSLFPTGQFVPRWMRWPTVAFLALQIPFTFFPALAALDVSAVSLGFLLFLGGVPLFVAAQLYRYRRVSSPLERQQTKWVVFGFAVVLLYLFLGVVPYLLFPVLAGNTSFYLLVYTAVEGILLLLIPLSFGFAILRSRLWDIDVLINRTLVYGLLTTSLLAMYLVLVFGGQYLLASLFGKNNQVVLVVSTLIVASLAVPLRRRMQALVDRRFYRSKYDAGRVVARFNDTLRHEVHLEPLCEQLLAVVEETMQPAHLSLWIFESERMSIPSLQIGTLPSVATGGDKKATGHDA
jgi:hypothetical protein